jgi:hypothetical protein
MECQDQNLSGPPGRKRDAEENGFELFEKCGVDVGFGFGGLG